MCKCVLVISKFLNIRYQFRIRWEVFISDNKILTIYRGYQPLVSYLYTRLSADTLINGHILWLKFWIYMIWCKRTLCIKASIPRSRINIVLYSASEWICACIGWEWSFLHYILKWMPCSACIGSHGLPDIKMETSCFSKQLHKTLQARHIILTGFMMQWTVTSTSNNNIIKASPFFLIGYVNPFSPFGTDWGPYPS